MFRKRRLVSLLNKSKGFTIIEMLVTLTIISILAAIAVPYVEITIKRSKEMELRAALRTIRTAIDEFNGDWKKGVISKFCDCFSEAGYPKNLYILVEGVDIAGTVSQKKKYLRKIPVDPFADQSLPAEEQWGLRSYNDKPDSRTWSGEDVYDIYTKSEKKAIDGSYYVDW